MNRPTFWKRWRVAAPALLAVAATTLAACGGDGDDAAGGTTDITITMSSASLSNQTVFTADSLGIFTKNGLNVRLVTASAAAQSMAALLSGDAQFSMGSRDDAITAKLQGRDVVYAAKHQAGWRAGIVISKKLVPDPNALASMSLDDKLKLLDGKRFASPSASSALTNLSKAAFTKAGVQVNYTYLEGSVMPQALKSGSIDGFIQTSPFQEQVSLNGSGVVLVKGPDVPGSGGATGLWAPLLATSSYVQENPEVVKKVLASYFEAARWTKENPDKAKELAGRRLKLAKNVFDLAWENNVDGLTSPFDKPLTADDVALVLQNDFPGDGDKVKVSDVLIDQSLIDSARAEAASADWLGQLTPKQ